MIVLTADKDLVSLQQGFQEKEGTVAIYLHATDIAHFDHVAYIQLLALYAEEIALLKKDFDGGIIISSAMGRNDYGNGITDVSGHEAHDHHPGDPGTGQLAWFTI